MIKSGVKKKKTLLSRLLTVMTVLCLLFSVTAITVSADDTTASKTTNNATVASVTATTDTETTYGEAVGELSADAFVTIDKDNETADDSADGKSNTKLIVMVAIIALVVIIIVIIVILLVSGKKKDGHSTPTLPPTNNNRPQNNTTTPVPPVRQGGAPYNNNMPPQQQKGAVQQQQRPYNNMPSQQLNGMPSQQRPYRMPPQQPNGMPSQRPDGMPSQRPGGMPSQRPDGMSSQRRPYNMPPQQPDGMPSSFRNQTGAYGGAMADAGETMVLGEGETPTTVLSGGVLLRKKNNTKITVNKPEFTIGREKRKVDYCISDNSSVSRTHARIRVRAGRYYIADLNSANSTYVNGNKLSPNQEVELRKGDKIIISDEEFEFLG